MKKKLPNESLWRGTERAQISRQPELAVEARLTAALEKIPDAPVASNFTARVLQAVEREDARRSRLWNFHWHSLLPRVALGMAVVLFAGLTFQHHERAARRVALAQSVAMIAGTRSLPDLEALKNFDAIQRMSQPAHADEEILAMQP